MSVQVYTARINTRDPDAVDVTRKSADEHGRAFAPSWSLLGPALDGLRRGDPDAWVNYVAGFHVEMRASYVANRAAWDALLARERVVLTCYCTDHTRCHRTLLARDILPKLGATYRGELTTPAAAPGKD